MTHIVAVPPAGTRSTEASRRISRPPPLLLRATLASIFIFPANMVLAPMGAAGTVPLLLALVLTAFWLASVVWGLHDPVPVRHPGRMAISALLLANVVSGAALYLGTTGDSTVAARAAADRWLLLLLASAGLILVCGEVVRTLDDAMRCVRAMLAGALFCCLIAAVQFVFHVDPALWIQLAMPGFSDNGGDTSFQARGALVRVAGIAFSPIELGVVSAMLLPLALWRVIYDTRRPSWIPWLQTAALVFAIAASVSRSGVLAIAVALAVTGPFLPRIARRWMTVLAPVAVASLFLAVPGLMGTLGGALGADASDPSISTRLDNYPRVAAMLDERPLLGTGPGNYMPTNALHILDNQYLHSLVTMGIIGLIGTVVYFWLPGVTGLHAARSARDPALRSLAGALAAGCLAGGVCSVTFDSLSFPVFALTYPALVGMSGAAWLMARQQEDRWTPPMS